LPGIFKSIDKEKSNLIDEISKDKKFNYYLERALKD
tara:strand:+ start:794 stop:901 length:108 start_codon:yes stop_codon:yes gene_type:complete